MTAPLGLTCKNCVSWKRLFVPDMPYIGKCWNPDSPLTRGVGPATMENETCDKFQDQLSHRRALEAKP